MNKIGERICSHCGGVIPLILDLTVDYICQKCGSADGILKTDVNMVNAHCIKCDDSFSLLCNEAVRLVHVCGSSILNLSISSPQRKIIQRKIIRRKEKVTIIIVTWNNLHHTKNCVKSIRAKTPDPYNFIFVDNFSTDGTPEYLRSVLNEGDILICLSKNYGFSKANNIGLELVKDGYVCFLNNDTIVMEGNWIDILYHKIYSKDTDLVGPTLRKVKPVDARKIFEFIGTSKDPNERWSYLEGWCLFIKAKKMKKLGGFDERFFVYSEDADLSFKIKAEKKKIATVNIPVRHLANQSSKLLEAKDPGHSVVSNRLLYRKWVDNSLKSLLIVRRGAIGDVLYTTSIVKALHKKYPKTPITYMTSCPQLIKNNPYIDKIVRSADVGSFEKVIYLKYEDIPNKNLIAVMAVQADVKLKDKRLEIYIGGNHSKERVERKKITIHTGRTWKSREWPLNRFREVVGHFISKGYKIVELGDKKTKLTGIAGTIDARDLDWNMVVTHIAESEFFFGLDSAPSVIAKALEVPAFIIYGCVDPATRYTGAKEYPLWDDTLECKGCRGRVRGAVTVDCHEGHINCLMNIKSQMVVDEIEKYLKKKGN